MSQKLKLSLRILVSLALLSYLFSTLELDKLADGLKQISLFQFCLAAFFFQLSKLLAAVRFSQLSEVKFGKRKALAVVYRAGFFSLFLPGGLGGDAYRGKIIYDNGKMPVSMALRLIAFERLSGLIQLVSIIVISASFLEQIKLKQLMLIVFAIALFVYALLAKKVTRFDYLRIFRIDICSLSLQLCQCITYVVLVLNLAATDIPAVFLLFGLSSIASMLPVSFSGIGSREAVFVSLGFISGIELSELITASISFTMISLASSLVGGLVILQKSVIGLEEK